MSYARIGCGDSMVYVIADTQGGFTCFCGPVFRCETRRQMVAHLEEHAARGQNAEVALAGLRAEIAAEAPSREEGCPCGKPLHYSSVALEAVVRKLIAELGPTIPVTVGGRTWRVPRHWIALHGLRARDLPRLGFEEGVAP